MSDTKINETKIRRPLFWLPFKAIFVSALITAGTFVLLEVMVRCFAHRWLTLTTARSLYRMSQDNIDVWFLSWALLYAMFRTTRYHPALQSKYYAWLSSTPWRRGRPLPVGPPYLVWEDLFPAIIIVLLCNRPAFPFTAFVFVYAVMAFRVVVRGRDGKWFSGLIVSVGALLVLIWPNDRLAALIELSLLFTTDLVVRRSLGELPWVRPVQYSVILAKTNLGKSKWPLAPLKPMRPLSAIDGWAVAAISAWSVYCLTTQGTLEDPRDLDSAALIVAGALLFVSLVRWLIYCRTYQPPISTWGRLRTLRFVIPGYDYALIAPMAAASASVVLPLACWTIGWKYPAVLAITTFVVISIIMNAGPTLAHWQLTGHHRILHQPQKMRLQA